MHDLKMASALHSGFATLRSSEYSYYTTLESSEYSGFTTLESSDYSCVWNAGIVHSFFMHAREWINDRREKGMKEEAAH